MSWLELLFTLGLNRVSQAAVITLRAVRSGIPFAPEKDGRTFPAGLRAGRDWGHGWEHDRGHDRGLSRRY